VCSTGATRRVSTTDCRVQVTLRARTVTLCEITTANWLQPCISLRITASRLYGPPRQVGTVLDHNSPNGPQRPVQPDEICQDAAMIGSAPLNVHLLGGSGIDWPSIAAVISTGLVGVLGVGSAIWQATRGWSREDRRQHRAEKRRVYVSMLDTLSAFMGEVVKLKAFEDGRRADDTLEERRAKLDAASDANSSTIGSLLLIAPDSVTSLAQQCAQFIYDFIARDVGSAPTASGMSTMPYGWLPLRQQLVSAMRADLGEVPATGLITADSATDAAALGG